MEEFTNQVLGFLTQLINSLVNPTEQSPILVLCSIPLVIIVGIRVVFGKYALMFLFRILFACILGIVVFGYVSELTPFAVPLSILIPVLFLLLLEKRVPTITLIFEDGRLLASANLMGLGMGILAGVAILFVLNWIGWKLPGEFLKEVFSEFGSFLVPIVCFGVGYIAGAKFNLLSVKNHQKSLIWLSSIVASVSLLASWNYFSYREFHTHAIAILAEEYSNPEATLDKMLFYETGYHQAVGYYVLSARTQASVSILDEDYDVPEGGLSTLINWGKRILILVGSILLVRKGLYEVLLERITEGGVSGKRLWEYIDEKLDAD